MGCAPGALCGMVYAALHLNDNDNDTCAIAICLAYLPGSGATMLLKVMHM
jgi:hypothetical protein